MVSPQASVRGDEGMPIHIGDDGRYVPLGMIVSNQSVAANLPLITG